MGFETSKPAPVTHFLLQSFAQNSTNWDQVLKQMSPWGWGWGHSHSYHHTKGTDTNQGINNSLGLSRERIMHKENMHNEAVWSGSDPAGYCLIHCSKSSF